VGETKASPKSVGSIGPVQNHHEHFHSNADAHVVSMTSTSSFAESNVTHNICVGRTHPKHIQNTSKTHPKHIQNISKHIQTYPNISKHIQRFRDISNTSVLPTEIFKSRFVADTKFNQRTRVIADSKICLLDVFYELQKL
jgi:hypothetical protein